MSDCDLAIHFQFFALICCQYLDTIVTVRNISDFEKTTYKMFRPISTD